MGTNEALAEEAVLSELVSAVQFPANREKYREFFNIWRSIAISIPNRAANSIS